ncbi:MAG: PH domain-containing protein [Gammaproteobacteria bacterium]|nr:PH domain-containing protein [Gammaproteobacteria bacterium]MDH5305417.1 PH domain-containing protein [Gammaproteobacteria bacterium]
MFQNPEIPLDTLPSVDSVQWQALAPAYKRLRQLQALLVAGAASVPLLIVTFLAGLAALQVVFIWLTWAILSTALLLWPTLSLPRRGYVVRDRDIIFRHGVVWRSVTAIPFNRIQHVETSSTPFDRKFELATLQLFTAGGSSGDLKIDGLESRTAEQLRVFVLQKTGASIEHA